MVPSRVCHAAMIPSSEAGGVRGKGREDINQVNYKGGIHSSEFITFLFMPCIMQGKARPLPRGPPMGMGNGEEREGRGTSPQKFIKNISHIFLYTSPQKFSSEE